MVDESRIEALDHPSRPVAFGLAELILGITWLGGSMGLVKMMGLFGLLIVFSAAHCFCFWMYSFRRVVPHRRPRWLYESKRIWLSDLIWGIVLPLLCFWVDPFVFSAGDLEFLAPSELDSSREVTEAGRLAYPLVTYQMVIMVVWLLAGRGLAFAGSFFAGSMLVGSALAAAIGICLLPMSIMGTMLMGVGLIGLTPLFTARAYGRRGVEAWQAAPPHLGWGLLSMSLGAAIAIGGPLAWHAWRLGQGD